MSSLLVSSSFNRRGIIVVGGLGWVGKEEEELMMCMYVYGVARVARRAVFLSKPCRLVLFEKAPGLKDAPGARRT